MSLINVSNLTFAYEGSYDNIFENVSFQIDTDWKLGFCGRNGRGKTTFLKLLMNKYSFSGTISSSVKFDYFPLEVSQPEDSTIEVLNSVAPCAELWQIQKEISKLAVSEDVLYRSFSSLSGGEQTKVLLAALFLRENNFLLIDEPINHLDSAARETVAQYLKNKKSFILVSHDRAFLDECIDHVLSINKNNIEIISGNFSVWSKQKEFRDMFEAAQNRRLEQEISRLKKSATQTADWSNKVEKTKNGTCKSGLKPDKGYVGHKAAKMMKRSKVIEKRQTDYIEEKTKLLQNLETSFDLKIQPLKHHSERLITLNNVSIFYDEKCALKNFNLTINQGDRLAISGGNGSGKSSVLKLICGESIKHTGQISTASRLEISYVPQDTAFLSGSLKEFEAKQQIDETLFRSMLNKLDFSRRQFEKDIGEYSAGQRKKLLLAASLCKPAHIYIWDEPLNYIDIISRIQIENLILECCPTLLFVEHDKTFCDKIATEVVKI